MDDNKLDINKAFAASVTLAQDLKVLMMYRTHDGKINKHTLTFEMIKQNLKRINDFVENVDKLL